MNNVAIVAVAVAEAVQVVGVLLVFTPVVAPPATAGYLVRRPRLQRRAIVAEGA